MNGRITVHCTTKDRHTEVSLLLQSLRTQSVQEFDIIVLDDASGLPLSQCYFFMSIVNRMKIEGHKIKLLRNEISQGVCHARNTLIENDDFENEYVYRADDDTILEADYFERLLKVISSGYDLASGIVPYNGMPELKREVKNVKPIINRHALDAEGNIVVRNDDCGYGYIESEILPTHQFRTAALYKKKAFEGIKYPVTLSFTGFREELWFSFQAILKGLKLGVDTGAIAYHLQTPSGGVRSPDYAQRVMLDEETTNRWVRDMFLKHGNFLLKYEEQFK